MEYEIIDIRDETPEEKALYEWFDQMVFKSPDNLEAAARQILTLVTALLGVLFTVLAVAKDPLPNYFVHPIVHWLGAASVILLLLALLAALLTLLPRRITASAELQERRDAFEAVLKRKSRFLTAAAWLFFFALVALGAVLLIAIIEVQ